jgi:hypothetical protein
MVLSLLFKGNMNPSAEKTGFDKLSFLGCGETINA